MLLNNIINAGIMGKGLYDLISSRNNKPWQDPDLAQPQANNANQLNQYNASLGSPTNYSDSNAMPMRNSAPLASPDSSFIQPMISGGGPDLNELKSYAMSTYPNNPVMQQVVMTQALLESGRPGEMSGLATNNHNLFGIKGSAAAPGTDPNIAMNTMENGSSTPYVTRADFSANKSYGDSFNQHRRLLTGLPRYTNVVNAKTPEEAFKALQQAGYATDPSYSKKLLNINQQYIRPLFPLGA